MDTTHLLRARQVADRSRYPQHPGITPRRKTHRFGCLHQQGAASFAEVTGYSINTVRSVLRFYNDSTAPDEAREASIAMGSRTLAKLVNAAGGHR